MAQHKNALIRYKTIDKCLQNHYKEWTLNDLIEACSDALYELENRPQNISKRTIQLDIQNMRSDKLGYNAPIVVYNKKYYRYEDEDYSITQLPVSENDIQVLTESVSMLKQFQDFSLFSDLGEIVTRLEDVIHTEKNNQPSIIHMDKNNNLKGLEHLDTLYQAILKKMVLEIEYKSFKARHSSIITIHPYILKEFNNRWFLIGANHKRKDILNLALDRIININFTSAIPFHDIQFNADEYYKNTIGATVMNDEQLKHVVFKINARNAPYVVTKPFHHSQKTIEVCDDRSMVFEIYVHLNFELERMILGFGDSIEVLAPNQLRRRIKRIHKDAYARYAPNNS
ncbi:helix-turn-helix transcriptional regulator [Wenyingzhuangia sp. IMCC45574]